MKVSIGIRNFSVHGQGSGTPVFARTRRNALDGSRGAPTTISIDHILAPDAMVIRKAGPKSDHRPAVMRVRSVPMWRHLFSAAAHFPATAGLRSTGLACRRTNGSCTSRGGGEFGHPSPWLRADVACHLVGGLPRATLLRHRPTCPGVSQSPGQLPPGAQCVEAHKAILRAQLGRPDGIR
jgi:hypothetical protein